MSRNNELRSTKSPVPWQLSYQPALPNDNVKFFPMGVIDIDAIPHACCLHSYQSHAGYLWISSQRRCGCALDSNYNKSESMTEAYLGRYGVIRYGAFELACMAINNVGNNVGNTTNVSDWKTKQWWFMQTQKAIEISGSVATSISTAISSVRNEGDLSLSCSTSCRVCASELPFTVESHINYMQRQPFITIDMRQTLMDWLLEVTKEYKLSSDMFWLSVTSEDRVWLVSMVERGVAMRVSASLAKKCWCQWRIFSWWDGKIILLYLNL